MAELPQRRPLWRAFGPPIGPVPRAEMLRAATGGLLALALLGALAVASGGGLALPLGASAVLVFALPNSPLAQPWSVMVGNCASALTGAAVALLLPDPAWAPALAFACALAVMMATRSLHPPGGAMAVTAAMLTLEGGGGPLWALWPVAGESAILVAAGLVWNRATGRVYPFRQPAEQGRHATPDPAPERRLGLAPDRLRAILARFRQGANIGVEDLARLIDAAESEAAARRFGGLTCAEVMSRAVVAVRPDDTIQTLAGLIQRHGFTSFPVVIGPTIMGIVTQGDLIRGVMARGRRGLRVADIMTHDVRMLPADAPVARLLPLLSDAGVPAVPIVDDGRLAGIVTRSDMLALLAHELALAGSP